MNPGSIGPARPDTQPAQSSVVVSRASVTAAPAKPSQRDPWGTPPPGYVPGRGRGATGFAGGVSRDDASTDHDRTDYNDRNFDEFTGYQEALFKDAEYDEEDRQADMLYDSIEMMMDMRRRSRREQKLKTELAKLRAEKPTIHQQFADLKSELATVSRDEWDALPTAAEAAVRTKRQRHQRFQRAPDNLLLEAAAKNLNMTGGLATPADGLATPAGGGMATPLQGFASTVPGGTQTSFGMQTPFGLQTPYGLQTPAGLATPFGLKTPHNEASLGVKLDSVIESTSSRSSVIDPQGYLTALQSMPGMTGTELVNINKSRSLMSSIVGTNPNNPKGWIAYARLEERANRICKARDIIAEGCSKCPYEEELWMEAARLHGPEEAKMFLSVAVKKYLPNSVRLWVERASRETDQAKKRLILRRGLEQISNSVRLWKEAVEIEDEADARVMLLRAVECVPQAVELWLKLAAVSSHEDARKALNEARKNCPTSVEIWVAAAELEDTRRDAPLDVLVRLLVNGLKKLKENDVVFDRSIWLQHAYTQEEQGRPKSCQAIIAAIATQDQVASKALKHQRLDEVETALQSNHPVTARAILEEAVKLMPTKKSLWMALINLEQDEEKIQAILHRACEALAHRDLFWLMLAKRMWLNDDVEGARSVLARAMEQVEEKESVVLAAVKLERETGHIDLARQLLLKGIEDLDSPSIWMQLAQLERRVRKHDDAERYISQALEKYPKDDRLWMIAGAIELERDLPQFGKASELFERGLKAVPKSGRLWMCAIDCDLKQGKIAQARAKREKAAICAPQDEMLWLKAVEIEKADPQSTITATRHLLTRGLQECPKSGLLWAESIWLQDPATQSARAAEALNVSENHPYTVLAAACLFWQQRKEKKAREWFNRALELGAHYGDVYGDRLAFEIAMNKPKEIKELMKAAENNSPLNEGYRWNRVNKKVENWTKSVPETLCEFVATYHPEVVTQLGSPLTETVMAMLR